MLPPSLDVFDLLPPWPPLPPYSPPPLPPMLPPIPCSKHRGHCYVSRCCERHSDGCFRMVGERIAICQSYEYFGAISLCEDSDEWLCPESWLARPPPMPPLPPFTAYPPPPGFPDFERLHFHVAPPPPKALSRHTQIANSIMEYTSIVVEGLFVCVVIFFVYLFFAAGFGRSSTLKRRKVRRSRNGSGAGAEDAADGEEAEETAWASREGKIIAHYKPNTVVGHLANTNLAKGKGGWRDSASTMVSAAFGTVIGRPKQVVAEEDADDEDDEEGEGSPTERPHRTPVQATRDSLNRAANLIYGSGGGSSRSSRVSSRRGGFTALPVREEEEASEAASQVSTSEAPLLGWDGSDAGVSAASSEVFAAPRSALGAGDRAQEIAGKVRSGMNLGQVDWKHLDAMSPDDFFAAARRKMQQAA